MQRDSSSIRLVIHGAAGRMGQRIAALAQDDPQLEVVAQLDNADGFEHELDPALASDVIIDFSSDAGAQHAVQHAVASGAALLIGTTGLSRQTIQATDVAAKIVPIMIAANTSVGIAVLTHLAVQAARLLATDCTVNLLETHHVHKRDAPSGTALRIAEALRERAQVDLRSEHIHAIRAGDVIGDHTIEFSAEGERIRLTHMATDRDLFARGALRAARWLAPQPAGRYTIENALNLAGG